MVALTQPAHDLNQTEMTVKLTGGANAQGVLLRLPQPVPIVVGNDERIAFIVAQIADEGLVDDRVATEVLAR